MADHGTRMRPGETPLPTTREELLALHEHWRARRKAAELGSDAYVEAADQLGRIEIQIARIERAMNPPRV